MSGHVSLPRLMSGHVSLHSPVLQVRRKLERQKCGYPVETYGQVSQRVVQPTMKAVPRQVQVAAVMAYLWVDGGVNRWRGRCLAVGDTGQWRASCC